MTDRRIIVALSIMFAPTAFADAMDPAVPPGRDPGGFPVAIVGRGLDYTDAAIAQRLARDGEGEITGYDFIDNDRRPFAPTSSDKAPSDTNVARIILAEGQATSLIIVRADLTDVSSIAKAIGFAAKSPTRVMTILAPYADAQMRSVVVSAARYFPEKLIIVSAVGDGNNLVITDNAATQDLANLLVVTAANKDGTPIISENLSTLIADVAVPINGVELDLATSQTNTQYSASLAASRIAALAARLIAVEPEKTAGELKARILSLAQPWPTGPDNEGSENKHSKHGWIKQPRRHFWLE